MRTSVVSLAKKDRGFTLVELLVVFLIVGVLLGNLMTTLMQSTNQYHDREIITKTEERARMLLDIMAFELRLMGSGMPLGQEDFAMDDLTLGDAPLPLLLSSDATNITFRMSEVGTMTALTSDFDTSLLSSNLDVESNKADKLFKAGDIVYVSDFLSGGDAGMRAEVTASAANQLVIDNSFLSTPAAVFPSGSTVSRVSTITFAVVAGAVNRDTGGAPAVVMPNSTFTITYLDDAGNPLTPPLTRSQIQNELQSIDLSVSVTSNQQLKDGNFYTATAEQNINLRNLHLSRP